MWTNLQFCVFSVVGLLSEAKDQAGQDVNQEYRCGLAAKHIHSFSFCMSQLPRSTLLCSAQLYCTPALSQMASTVVGFGIGTKEEGNIFRIHIWPPNKLEKMRRMQFIVICQLLSISKLLQWRKLSKNSYHCICTCVAIIPEVWISGKKRHCVKFNCLESWKNWPHQQGLP